MSRAVLAVDVGTSATKAALIGDDGTVHSAGESPHPTISPRPSWMEQDPARWWDSTRAAVGQALSGAAGVQVAALTVTGQMQDLVPMDADGPLRMALLYSDTRAAREHERLSEAIGSPRWARITGNVQDPSNIAAKWMWLLEHEARLGTRTEKLLLGAHSYIAWRACGARVCDATTASTTGLLDLRAGEWAHSIVSAAGLDASLLPRIVTGASVVGQLSEVAATELGLAPGLAVVHAPGDAATTTVGVGAAAAGVRYVYLGTSGWVAGTFPGVPREPSEQLYSLRHATDGVTLRIGPMLSVGSCIDWALSAVADAASHADLSAAMAHTAPGPSRVLFLPYLAGERTPHRDANARGAFVGLSHSVGRADLLRSVIEGVCFALSSIDEFLGAATELPLLVCGGGSSSNAWCQVLADVVGRDVVRTEFAHAGTLGAAMTAADALGWCELAANSWPSTRARQTFSPERHGEYAETYEVFKGLYPALKDSFRAMARAGETQPSTRQ